MANWRGRSSRDSEGKPKGCKEERRMCRKSDPQDIILLSVVTEPRDIYVTFSPLRIGKRYL
jgi:hypothetical protein